jgi:GT2 family glycosyltransferase
MRSYLGVVGRLRRDPARLFNTEYYLASNPDVAASRIDPLWHFVLFGGFEGRKPNALFDPEFYLRECADVADTGVNPLLHYLKHGAAEGRRPHPLYEADSVGPENSLTPFLRALEKPAEAILYSWWMRLESRATLPQLTVRPRFSVLMAIGRPRRDWLEAAIASVREQSYRNWELCICSEFDEGWLKEYLDGVAEVDERIRVTYTHDRLPDALALNRAAMLATGDYVTVLYQADRLRPDALYRLATGAPSDLIYSDEDHLDAAGGRTAPLFKPDWSPDLLLSCMYIGRIMAISRAAWERSGGFRQEYEGTQDYDLALRVTENGGSVQHITRVLYSRRDDVEAGAQGADAARRCLLDAVRRRAVLGEVEAGPRPATFRLRWKASRENLASVIICSRSAQLLERCLASLEAQTAYPRREIIVVQHLDGKPSALETVIARYRALRLTYAGPFHFSKMNNLAAKVARGEFLVFLNDDTEVLDSSWLDRLAGQVERPDVGIVGARLLYPSGTLQHGGVAIGVGPGCAHIGRDTATPVAHWPWLDLTRDVSAVTGACMAIRRQVFGEVGSFAEAFPVNYNDIDLCLRVREAGYRVIYDAGVIMRHYECQSRVGVVTAAERRDWEGRWGKRFKTDPFYTPSLSREREDLSLGTLKR